MVPQKIKPYFELMFQKQDSENSLLAGVLTCCSSHNFEVRGVGKIKHRMFSKMYLLPYNDILALEAYCKKCAKTISVFDSKRDGYERCANHQHIRYKTKPVICKKCQSGNFRVEIKYEYPDVNELKNLEITEIDNAFTWIWATLECNECGTRYKNFIDCETA